MWETVVLSSAGGTLTAVGVWRCWTWIGRRATSQQLRSRLRRCTAGADGPLVERPVVALRDARYSVLPFLDRIIRRGSGAPRIKLFLQQADARLNVSTFVLLHLCCAASAGLMASWLRLPMTVVLPLMLAAGATPFALMRVRRQRRLHRLTVQLPDAIRLIASSLRAGIGLEVGLNTVVEELPDPIRSEFRQLVNESLLEVNMSDAFHRLARRVPIGDYQLFASAASLHREVGGNFAALLDQLEETVRERFRLYRELHTMTALSRFEGLLLVMLPPLVTGILFILNPDYFSVFWEDPAGQTLLWAAIALQLIGVAVIQWMTQPRIQ